MKILITGAAGFIGYHLASRLLSLDHAVVGVDNLNDYYEVFLKHSRLELLNKKQNFSFKLLDVADLENFSSFFEEENPDIVVHLAAQAGVRYSLENPGAYIHSNINGFLSVLEATRYSTRLKHLIYASSSSVYGANESLPFRESDRVERPLSLYAATKLSNELMAHTYSHLFGIPMTGLRFFTVYGPWGRPDMAYFKFSEAILEGRPIQIYNGGEVFRDFTYIDDIVSSIAALINLNPPTPPLSSAPGSSNASTRVLNIGGSRPVAVMDMVALLEEGLGKKATIEYLAMQPGDAYRTAADTTELVSLTGKVPETRIENGISDFCSWFKTWKSLAS